MILSIQMDNSHFSLQLLDHAPVIIVHGTCWCHICLCIILIACEENDIPIRSCTWKVPNTLPFLGDRGGGTAWGITQMTAYHCEMPSVTSGSLSFNFVVISGHIGFVIVILTSKVA